MISAKLPFLARLGIYRISSEKQETLLKLLALSTAAILCKTTRLFLLPAFSLRPIVI